MIYLIFSRHLEPSIPSPTIYIQYFFISLTTFYWLIKIACHTTNINKPALISSMNLCPPMFLILISFPIVWWIPINQRSNNGYDISLSSFRTINNRNDLAMSTPKNQWSLTQADMSPSGHMKMWWSINPSQKLSSTAESREYDPSLQL